VNVDDIAIDREAEILKVEQLFKTVEAFINKERE